MGITTKIKSLHLLAVVFMLMSTTNLSAQLTGVKTIPGNYATVTAAVTALNTQGVGTGGVTFNVASGYTQSITAPIIITATGTAANPIVFQKSGTGANPVITRTDGGTINSTILGAQADAIVIIEGSDFLTFNGINLTASVASSTTTGIENGFYLRKVSGTNGCKNITITNSTITMNKGTSGVVTGIMSSNNDALSTTSSATGIFLANVGGRNENLTFSNNTIRNVHNGIYVRGFLASTPFDLYDHNITITGNTFNNLGGGSTSTSYGLYMIYYHDVVASNNVYNNIASGGVAGTGFRYGLMFSSSSDHGNLTVTNNTVTLTTTSGAKYAIYSSGSSPTGTLNISSNTISFPTNTQTGSTYGIYRFGTASSATMSNNTINSFTAASGIFYGIYNTGNGTTSNNAIAGYTMGGTSSQYPMFISNANMTAFGNTISNVTYTGTGTFFGFYIGNGNTTSSFYNNNISNVTAGGTTYGIYASFPTGMDVYNNSVMNITSTGNTSNLSGFYLTGGSGINFNRNKVANLTGTKAGSTVFGFNMISGSSFVRNNIIGDLKTPIASNTADAVRGISITSTTANTSHDVAYNTIYLNATSTGTNFSTSGIFHNSNATATTSNLTLRNNIIINQCSVSGTGIASVVRRSMATQLNNFNAASNNNMLFAGTPAANRVIYLEGTAVQQTLANYQTLVAPRDGYAMTGETFTYGTAGSFFMSLTPSNANFLKPVAGITTQVEGGAIQIAGITNDYANVTRAGNTGYTGTGAAPDRGAFEFNGVTTAPQITLTASLPSVAVSCTPSTHAFTFNIASSGSAVTSAVLSYAFNGTAQPNITLTNTSGTTWTATIPVATPVNATVTWSVLATNSAASTLFTGPTYGDAPLLGITAVASAMPGTICFGDSSSISVSLANTNAPISYTVPGVSSPLFDEDFGGITITQGSTTILSNTTPIHSLVGTIGTATGTEGSYSNFTAFGPYTMNAGQSYNFSMSSLTSGASYNNSMAIFIDYNRNGSFADAGEMVFAPAATQLGPHTVTGSFTIPATALNGQTRMRVVCLELLITSAASISSWGEFEDYMLNIVSTNNGGGAVPAITAVAWTSGSTAIGTTNPQTVSPTTASSYSALVSAAGCQVTSSSTTVSVLTLPTAPIVTNSTHCGFQIPTASVASVTNGGGTGAFNWYTDAAGTTSAQTPNYGPLATYWTNNFSTSTITNGLLSGVAAVTAGELVLHPNALTQSGGLTVNASGINTNAHEISFKYINSGGGVANTADGMAFSFGDDVNALAATPNAENGTGTKLKIAFDSYTNAGNTQGIYLMYNCNVANQTPTTPGVLAYVPSATWIGATSNVVVTINAAGVLNMTINGTPTFTNVQLPSAFLAENTANWAYVWRSRSGGISSGSILDDIVIKRAPIAAGPTTYPSVISSTTTFYVNENGTNGCISPTVPVVVTVTAPPAINIASSVTPALCLGANIVLTASSPASPAYAYSWNTASYPGSGMTAPSTGATRSLTPTVAGTYVYTVTGTNANCSNQVQQTVVVNPNPNVVATTATPVTPCHNSQMNLSVTSLVTGPQTLPTGYCPSNATSLADEEIFNVTFGTLNNSSVCGTLAPGPGSLDNRYSNYTTSVPAPNIVAGNTYPLSVQIGTCGGNFSNNLKVFIDLNRDGDFLDAGETIYASPATVVGPQTATATIVIPTTGVVPGLTLMRVVSVETSSIASINSCGTYSWGETEDYAVNLQIIGASPAYSYAWNTTPAITAATGSLTLSNTGTTPTTALYNVVLTDIATGCSTPSTTNTITINPLPIVNAGVDQLICSNNATMPATLTGSATFGTGLNYVWSGPVTGVTNGTPFQIGATGTFVVTGTDVNGCVDTDDVLITYSTIPVANAGVDQAICFNQTATLNASGVAPYTWTMTNYTNSGLTASVTAPSITVTPTAPGIYTYQVNVQNSVGCTNTDQAVLTVYALPVVNAGVDQTVCNASPATLSGSGAITYAWVTTHPSLNVSNATPFFPSQTASYTVTGTDINGCQNQDVAIVNIIPQPFVNAGLDQTICAGTPVILNATTNLASPTAVVSPFTWTGGYANNSQFVPTTSQTLTVSVVGANGCTNQDQMSITVLALPTVNAGVDQNICLGTGATLNATGAATYVWNNNVTQGVPFFPTASQIYTVTGIGANGCTNVDQVQVNVATGPSVTVSAAQTVCANDAATFSAVPQNSLGGFWTTSGNGTITPSISSAAITYLPAANDPVVVTLTYVATNACGSTSSATNVNVLPIPTVNAGPDQTICAGSSVVLNATGNATVTWLTPNVSNGLAFVPVTTTTYTATATGLNNCSNQDQVTVTVVALPDVDAGDDVTICSGEQVTLAATGATAYQWTGGIANGTAFAPGTTATYTVTGTTVNGCASTDQVTVYVNATPEAIASIVDDVTLTATPGVYNYQWINCATGTAVPNASFATFNALANGTYAVIVSTPQGCSDQSDCITIDAVSVDELAKIAMSVQPNPTSGDLSISMPTELTAQAQVFDAQGKLVIDLTNVSNGSTLNLSNMTTGVYMVRITAADAVQTFRVVKQ